MLFGKFTGYINSWASFMSIVIHSLDEERGTATWALVSHGKNVFNALVNGGRSKLMSLLNQEQLTEMSFENVVHWRELPGFRDEESGIEAAHGMDDGVTLKGRVHNVVEVGEESNVIDVYLQAGPEFLAVSSQELRGKVPEVGVGIEITVQGLCFYPTGI